MRTEGGAPLLATASVPGRGRPRGAPVATLLALALAASTLVPAPAARDAPVVGEPFGPLLLPTVDGGGPFDLGSLRGRKVLLIEFASW